MQQSFVVSSDIGAGRYQRCASLSDAEALQRRWSHVPSTVVPLGTRTSSGECWVIARRAPPDAFGQVLDEDAYAEALRACADPEAEARLLHELRMHPAKFRRGVRDRTMPGRTEAFYAFLDETSRFVENEVHYHVETAARTVDVFRAQYDAHPELAVHALCSAANRCPRFGHLYLRGVDCPTVFARVASLDWADADVQCALLEMAVSYHGFLRDCPAMEPFRAYVYERRHFPFYDPAARTDLPPLVAPCPTRHA